MSSPDDQWQCRVPFLWSVWQPCLSVPPECAIAAPEIAIIKAKITTLIVIAPQNARQGDASIVAECKKIKMELTQLC